MHRDKYLYDLVQYTFEIINTTINQYWGTVNNFMSNKTAWARLYHNDVFIASHLYNSTGGEYTREGVRRSSGETGIVVGEQKRGRPLRTYQWTCAYGKTSSDFRQDTETKWLTLVAVFSHRWRGRFQYAEEFIMF